MSNGFSWSNVLSSLDDNHVVDLEAPIVLEERRKAPRKPAFEVPKPRLMTGFVQEEPEVEIKRTAIAEEAEEGAEELKAASKGNPYLGEMLVANKLIAQEELDRALQVQCDNPAPLGRILVRLGYISETLLLRALAAQMGVSPWQLEKQPPTPEAIALMPLEVCEQHQMLPVSVKGDLLVLAMKNPMDVQAIDLARNLSKHRIETVLPNEDRLLNAIAKAMGKETPTASIDNLVTQALDEVSPRQRMMVRDDNHLGEIDTRPVVGMVNQVLSDAIRSGVSDVHIEPRHNRLEVRYRLDGQMNLVRELPAELTPMIAARLKIMSELDIVETRLPQDGHITVKLDGRTVDIRISVCPNFHGPRIVLRILDRAMSLKKLDDLGFTPHNLELFRGLVDKPYGLFLVTGPTGSGKTTTLYAALGELNDGKNTILTCEDPVEYDIDGIGQSQVNEKVGLTFAKQLRALLRQDPDVILVGEIRDSETADTAIRASITGHMVLSTLHCNNAPGAIPRLLDMDIDPFLLSTSLVGVMSQRLVRILCPDCRVRRELNAHDNRLTQAYMGEGFTHEWTAPGCPKCKGNGFKGRRAVHEIMPVTGAVSDVIAKRGTVEELHAAAVPYGFRSLQGAVLELVKGGVTSLAEARRMIFFDESLATALPEARRQAA